MKWWQKFIKDMDKDLIETICHQVLDLYTNSKASKTPTGKQKTVESGTPLTTPAKKMKMNGKSRSTKLIFG